MQKKGGTLQLLFFVVGPFRKIDTLILNCNVKIEKLIQFDYSESSEFPLYLIEIWIEGSSSNTDISNFATALISKYSENDDYVIGMFDGTFMESMDLFRESNTVNIWLMKTPTVFKLAIDDECRNSNAWAEFVNECREEIKISRNL